MQLSGHRNHSNNAKNRDFLGRRKKKHIEATFGTVKILNGRKSCRDPNIKTVTNWPTHLLIHNKWFWYFQGPAPLNQGWKRAILGVLKDERQQFCTKFECLSSVSKIVGTMQISRKKFKFFWCKSPQRWAQRVLRRWNIFPNTSCLTQLYTKKITRLRCIRMVFGSLFCLFAHENFEEFTVQSACGNASCFIWAISRIEAIFWMCWFPIFFF